MIIIYFIHLLNLTPVQSEYTRQLHSRAVQSKQGRKGQLTNAADILPDEKEYRNKWTQTMKHEDIKTFQTRIYSSTI